MVIQSLSIAAGLRGSSEFFECHGSVQILRGSDYTCTYFEFAMSSVLLVGYTAREQTHIALEVGEWGKESGLDCMLSQTNASPNLVVYTLITA